MEDGFATVRAVPPGGPHTLPSAIWNLKYSGTHTGVIHLTRFYDPALLPAGFDANRLVVYHHNGVAWENLNGIVDVANHKISVTSNSLSPFALAVSPAAPVNVAASVSTGVGGTIAGAGAYAVGTNVTLVATPSAGYQVVNWSEGSVPVSTSPSYSLVASAAHTVVANLSLIIPRLALPASVPGSLTVQWPANLPGWVLQESPDLSPGSWVPSAVPVNVSGANNQAVIPMSLGKRCFRLTHP